MDVERECTHRRNTGFYYPHPHCPIRYSVTYDIIMPQKNHPLHMLAAAPHYALQL
jgi:hypothetical protein